MNSLYLYISTGSLFVYNLSVKLINVWLSTALPKIELLVLSIFKQIMTDFVTPRSCLVLLSLYF